MEQNLNVHESANKIDLYEYLDSPSLVAQAAQFDEKPKNFVAQPETILVDDVASNVVEKYLRSDEPFLPVGDATINSTPIKTYKATIILSAFHNNLINSLGRIGFKYDPENTATVDLVDGIAKQLNAGQTLICTGKSGNEHHIRKGERDSVIERVVVKRVEHVVVKRVEQAPHQGAKEIARRRRVLERNARKST